jgi:hypothetical protein
MICGFLFVICRVTATDIGGVGASLAVFVWSAGELPARTTGAEDERGKLALNAGRNIGVRKCMD